MLNKAVIKSKKRKINQDWEFAKFPVGQGMKALENGYSAWSKISLPHDWQIFDTGDLYENAEGWYRRELEWEPSGQEHTILYFEGVYMDSTLYVNGKEVGVWKYGYTSFYFDITEYVTVGINEILVRTVYQCPNSRWYSGAGIYRNVWFYQLPSIYFEPDGLYLTTSCLEGAYQEQNLEQCIREGAESDPAKTGKWQLRIKAELHCQGEADLKILNRDAAYSVDVKLMDEKKEIVVHKIVPVAELLFSTDLIVEHPDLWSDKTPNCYTLTLQLIRAGSILDTVTSNVGFRVFTFDADKGFFINGIYTKLYGVCQHHDLGALGAAFNKSALKRQFAILKAMGANAIRTSHNPPAPDLMELADEMGMLVVSEAFDMWERAKTEYDYARFFKEWSAKDVASWVRRDRNHPCVVMWSIGNEIYDTHADGHGQEITRYLMAEVKKHDPMCNAYVTIGSNYMAGENAQKCADIVKFAGYNYAARLYEGHHADHPDWIIYGSETSSTVQSRGIYHFPLSQSILTDDDEQCSSLGNSTTSWGARSIDETICSDRDHPFSLGQFLWSGFDYIGEPTPYHTKNSYFGMVDTAGFPKDAFYIMQAAWLDYRTKPMVHLYPYWDFNVGQMIDLRICSNAPEVELFFRADADPSRSLGISLGRQKIDHRHGKSVQANWRLAYEPGTLTAIAYDEQGNELAREVKKSFGDGARIRVSTEKYTMVADGEDLAFLEIMVEDKNGIPVENANNRMLVEVTGAGVLAGLDNGDSTDYDSYKGTCKRLFSGKLLAMVAAGAEIGEVKVRITSEGLTPAEIVLSVAENPNGSVELPVIMANRDQLPEWAALLPENRPQGYGSRKDVREIPVRKAEILLKEGDQLTAEKSELEVMLKRHPANATYQDVEWRVMNEMGMDVAFAKVENVNGHNDRVKISAAGDGKFLLRCGVKNGSSKVRVISQIEMKAAGIGDFAENPYEFVAGASYRASSGNLGRGSEKGISTPYDERVWMEYRNLDFGSFGSNEVMIPIFEFNSEEIHLKFWDGIPDQPGSTVIGQGTYHKQSIWETYQEQVFQLDRKLKGMSSFAIELQGKANIKGFCFRRPDKAFSKVYAVENDGIYGDAFTIEADAITGIGNNVSLMFRDMDFGAAGACKISVCGRTPLDRNTIQIRFSGADGESSQMVEFHQSDTYTEQYFELEAITGKQTITFVFLPGCSFDFKWFCFE